MPRASCASDPTWVLAASYTRPETLGLLHRAGVRPAVLDHFDSLDDVYASLRYLGRELGQEGRAEAVINENRARVMALAARLKGVKPVRVLSAGIYPFTAGAETTFQDICDHAGAINVAAEAGIKGHAPTPLREAARLERGGARGIRRRQHPRPPLRELPHYRVLPAYKACLGGGDPRPHDVQRLPPPRGHLRGPGAGPPSRAISVSTPREDSPLRHGVHGRSHGEKSQDSLFLLRAIPPSPPCLRGEA